MRSTAVEEGAIESEGAGEAAPRGELLGALERQKSSTFSVYSRPCVVAVELHAAQPVCCGAEVRGEIVLEAPQLLHVCRRRTDGAPIIYVRRC